MINLGDINPFSIKFIVGFLLMGFITAYFAYKSKKNYYIWFVAGTLYGIFAILFLLFLNYRDYRKNKKKKTLTKNVKKEEKQLNLEISLKDSKLWYYLDKENKKFGPHSLTRLERLLQEKYITENTYVWNQDLKNWKLLKNTKEYYKLSNTTNLT